MKNKKRIKKIISYISCIIIGYSTYPIINKQVEYYEARQSYEEYRKEKGDINKYPYWITIEGTPIDYPIAYGEGNDYYLYHDIEGKSSLSGSIFFEESEIPFDGSNTTIYGHSMRDGSMFNNLHKFRKDHDLFKNATLKVRNGEETKTYRPLSIQITNDKWIYMDLDDMTIDEAVTVICENSDYNLIADYDENSHIITLMTCEYTEEGNRLFTYWISE